MGHKLTKEENEYQNETKDIKRVFEKAVPMNILLIGPRNSGKSALINQYLNNEYSSIYRPTPRTSLCI